MQSKSLPISIAILTVVFSFLCSSGCRKETLTPAPSKLSPGNASHLEAETDETVYSPANYQQALDDVETEGGKLKFKNSSHFATTIWVLDSLGDSLSDIWRQNLGFNSLYSEYRQDLEDLPDDGEDEDDNNYFSGRPNTFSYNSHANRWDINAANNLVARVLNHEHKAIIGTNIFYSCFSADVTVGSIDEATIPQYAAMEEDLENADAIVTHTHSGLKTTGSNICSSPWDKYSRYIGEINCGSPIEKRSLCWLEAWPYNGFGGAKYTIGVVVIHHHKRSVGGSWKMQKRGSQVTGTFAGNFVNLFQINSKEAEIHKYGVCFLNGLQTVCAGSFGICVAPMCGGATLCSYW